MDPKSTVASAPSAKQSTIAYNNIASESKSAKLSPLYSSSTQKKSSSSAPSENSNTAPPLSDEKNYLDNASGQINIRGESSTLRLGSKQERGIEKEKKQGSPISRVETEYLDEEDDNKITTREQRRGRSPGTRSVAVDANPVEIGNGLRINSMTMKDANTNTLLWAQNCRDCDLFDGLIRDAHLPASILQCSAVTRTVNFSSLKQITSFSLIQKVLLHGKLIEQWSFQFGFVIPGSTNNWEQTIYAAPRAQMLPAQVLSGNLVIETYFLNKDDILAKTSMTIYYDD